MKKLTFLFALLLVAAMASANTLTSTCVPIASTPTELANNIVCSQFDNGGNPNLTLTGISIAVTGTITGTISLHNGGADPVTASGTTNSQFNITSLPGFTIVNPIFTLTYTTGNQPIAGGGTFTSGVLSNSATVTLTSASVAGYTGAGTFNIPVTTLSGLTILGGGGNMSGAQATFGQASAVITYEYADTTVPEPGTMLLIGMGLVGLGVWKFRK